MHFLPCRASLFHAKSWRSSYGRTAKRNSHAKVSGRPFSLFAVALGDISQKIIERSTQGRRSASPAYRSMLIGSGTLDDGDALETLMSRAKLCCGEFLAGFPSISNPFDEWVLLQRSKASNAIARLLGKLASLQIRDGHFEAAVGTAQQLVSLDPLREDSHRLLMEIYAKAGRRAEALRQYETCAQILRTELKVDPDVETTGLAKQLRKAGHAGVSAVKSSVPSSRSRRKLPFRTTWPISAEVGGSGGRFRWRSWKAC